LKLAQISQNPLTSVRYRIFLTCFILYSIHFATNVVREHYPAFSLIENFSFKVDKYQGFHSDIFRHSDGHYYIGNNVAGSVVAAIPLFIFKPVLDYFENKGKKQVRQKEDGVYTKYRIDKPNRQKFFKLVKEKGLHLKFGAATVVTSIILMAPLSALFVVLFFNVLIKRGVVLNRAIWLTILFGFATPIFFRTAHLNHNMFLMYAIFLSFYLLWNPSKQTASPSKNRIFWAGFLAGSGLAFDYSGVVPLFFLYGYLFFLQKSQTSFKRAFIESFPFIIGSIPPILFLLYSQWAMFGNPFLPGQYWMRDVNYTDRGWRGFSWPAIDLYFLNLFDPAYGMFTFAPLLIVGFIPVFFYRTKKLILPKFERRFSAVYIFLFLTFCAANQYSRMQFNTGFRYLLPLVPFVFLAACDHLNRLKWKWLIILSIPVLFHSWVLSMVREPVFVSWSHFLDEGFQLPWLTVLRLTNPAGHTIYSSAIAPLFIIGFTALLVYFIWRYKNPMFLYGFGKHDELQYLNNPNGTEFSN